MVPEINWSINARTTFLEAIKYLEESFSATESANFTNRVDEKLFVLKSFPSLGNKVKRKPNIYKTVVNKRVTLYYRFKPIENEIMLLSFWNTLQNPKRMRL